MTQLSDSDRIVYEANGGLLNHTAALAAVTMARLFEAPACHDVLADGVPCPGCGVVGPTASFEAKRPLFEAIAEIVKAEALGWSGNLFPGLSSYGWRGQIAAEAMTPELVEFLLRDGRDAAAWVALPEAQR